MQLCIRRIENNHAHNNNNTDNNNSAGDNSVYSNTDNIIFLTFFPSWKSFIFPSAFLRDLSSFMLSRKSWYCFCSAMFLGWLPIFCWISFTREYRILCIAVNMPCVYNYVAKFSIILFSVLLSMPALWIKQHYIMNINKSIVIVVTVGYN